MAVCQIKLAFTGRAWCTQDFPDWVEREQQAGRIRFQVKSRVAGNDHVTGAHNNIVPFSSKAQAAASGIAAHSPDADDPTKDSLQVQQMSSHT